MSTAREIIPAHTATQDAFTLNLPLFLNLCFYSQIIITF